MNAAQLYQYPQRWIAGLPDHREDHSLTIEAGKNPVVRHKTNWGHVDMGDNGYYPVIPAAPDSRSKDVCITDVPKFARDLIVRSSKLPQPKSTTDADGRESIKVEAKFPGLGDSALVYKPTSDAQAERNLRFAIANLTAYVEWMEGGKEAHELKLKAEKEAAERKAEAEKRKREEERKAAEIKRADELKLEKEALALLNASSGTFHYSWESSSLGSFTYRQRTKAAWIDVAKKAREAKAATVRIPSFDSLFGRPSFNSPTFDTFNFRL